MKIIILGASGNLGTQLTEVFKGYDLNTWDFPEVDFLNQETLKLKLDETKPDLVINAVAYNAVDKCETDAAERKLANELNYELPKFLATWCAAKSVFLIHYSTDYVFSGCDDKKEFLEDETPNPINEYGKSKARGEEAILSCSSLQYYLIRVSKLFGPQGASSFSKNSFFDLILNLTNKNEDIRVVDEEFSCFTYTPDLAQATKNLVTANSATGIYHLVNEGVFTWYGAVLELKKITNFSNKLISISALDFPRPAKRPKYSILKNTKTPRLRDFKEALGDYLLKK